MLKVLTRKPVPDWLSPATTDQSVPWLELLDGSLYYAACGIDGYPVRYVGGFCHSFVYADYGYPYSKISALVSRNGAFWGYQLRSARLLDVGEIDIASAWKALQIDLRLDGNPNRYRNRQVEPYAYWCIFERWPDKMDHHGPRLFSLLYLGMDGVAAFHALYYVRSVAPSVVAIIQPGEGFGYNWTYFFDDRQIYCRTVLGNPAGKPRYLLLGGNHGDLAFQTDAVWPEYRNLVKYRKTYHGHIGLWQHI